MDSCPAPHEVLALTRVKLSLSDFVVSFTEVAVIVGALFGLAGAAAGGTYVALEVVTFDRVPQVEAVHATELAVSVQETPLFDESLLTVATRTVTLPPAITLPVILFWMVTTIAAGAGGAGGVGDCVLPPPHPVTNPVIRIAPARILRPIASSFSPGCAGRGAGGQWRA